MRLTAAVIGQPIAHSLSPIIFSKLARERGVLLDYEAVEVSTPDLESFLSRMVKKPRFVGCNVTLPHKCTIVPYLDELSIEANAAQAVNVITHRDGVLRGQNTDISGILSCFEESCLQMRDRTALIYGSGGAARAAAYALGKSGAKLVLVANRTAKRAQMLCNDLRTVFPQTHYLAQDNLQEISEVPDLIIQATSLGLSSNDESPALPSQLHSSTVAFDLVYSMQQTAFLEQATRRSLRSIAGLDLLLWQAIATWEFWFGSLSDRKQMKEMLERELKHDKERRGKCRFDT